MKSEDLARATTPEQLAAAAQENAEVLTHFHHHHGHGGPVVRHETYKGHQIRVVTTYEITVDDTRVTGHLVLSNEGTVHYHSIPNEEFTSMIDMVKRIIDLAPEIGSGGHDHGTDH